MFFIAVLDFIGRVLLFLIAAFCAFVIGLVKLLIALPVAIVKAIRQCKANKQFSDEVDALAAEYLESYLLDDPVQPQFSDEEIRELVSEADALIHYGGQSITDVSSYLAAKYAIPDAVIRQVLMAAEAHNISENQKGDDSDVR